MDLVPLNLCVDTGLVPFNLSDFEKEEYYMNIDKVIRVLNTINDMLWDLIDVLIAGYDIMEVEENE